MNTNTHFMTSMMQVLTNALERNAYKRTRGYLLGLSDRHLDDMGFSRELLMQGTKAWPWRKPVETLASLSGQTSVHEGITSDDVIPANLARPQTVSRQPVQLNHPDDETKLAA